ncbi:sugar transferase [Acidaminobacter sp.]|uniref:sugar transferase n=1 Tax=Acidaminobacter sp. TaxID=1872102 RepID=UPI00137C6032|nr:sugar transferase [Acidaminobacter sp.]MDK9710954.1 sugar transferase [Acidaminobacter sp.]MZQ98594.1 exopolysaccharide biosynthesis polyprenyl glycosylphosphotransferase [Acidaminobacter sp.]
MLRWRRKIRYMAYIIIDILTILCALLLFKSLFRGSAVSLDELSSLEFIGLWSLVSTIYVTLFYLTSLYENIIEAEGKFTGRILMKTAACSVLAILLIHISTAAFKAPITYKCVVLLVSLILILQTLSRAVLKYIEFGKSEAIQTRNILVIGASDVGRRYVAEIQKHSYLNLNIIGYVKILDSDVYDDLKDLGTLEHLDQITSTQVVDELAVVKPLSFDPRIKGKLNQCQCTGITITMVLELQNTDLTKADVAMVGKIPVLKFHLVSLNEGQLFLKRLLDVSGALVGMLLFGFAFLIFAPLIKLESPGPVIFRQERVGKNGRVFTMWKFRSMVNDAESHKDELMESNEMNGHIFKIENDPRVTRVGAFLRKSSIDELPQFFNVLRGDMSLVGTRPPTVDEYRAYESSQRCRLSITPGLTGIWQISGRSDIKDFEEIVKMDIEYISNWSLLLDLHVILKTFGVVLSGRGSS